MNDPFDRELTISCGAALLNLCVAAEAAGFSSTPQLLPVSDDDDLLAAHRNSHGCVLRDDGARTAAATSASLVTGVTELMEHLRTSVES